MKKALRKIFDTVATIIMIGVMAVVMSGTFIVLLPIIAVCDAIIHRKSLCEAYGDVLNSFFEQLKTVI